ncbi:MAG: CHAT domain-containing protein, partial [Streptosporangiaceae bacterium]
SVVAPWEASSVATVTMLTEPTLEVPDDLRERTLAVLAGTDAGSKLLAAPDPAQIADALADTGADALVYLLPAREDLSAHAILMPVADAAGGSEPESVALPLLHTSLDGPLTGYAAAQRALLAISAQAGAQAGPAKQRWQDALELLCESAWPAVIGPLIEQVSRWRLNRPVRLVLVPVGELSQVPWHAAFCAPEPASSRRYACAEMVISYAVSGRQLIEVSRRPALALQDDPVVYSDRSLPFALLEAMAIHDCCYPAGRYLGYAPPEAGKAERGSPGQVLAELPAADHAGASMLHFGCHADVAGSAPGRSHLILARGEHLRVEEILRQAGGRSAFAPGGLVTLAACRSDLTAQDYDEALTLSTAFLAAGAVTVVGARWEVPDEDSPLLMFMFHHFMTAGGYSPRDALRLAQLWMLDEGRKPPPDMPEALAKDAGYPGLAELATWAAFTHQGR